ncbi:protein kinase family protein [Streptomyces fuscigenes]|uniref:protein kinase family protein n=1 Tax=Streptomyces fuscigenes TaxID=1528880 RepID=UPI001F31EF26|nr:protein kinase family protein [Streptomyces fuscigenes]MCF3962645.1 protein kinase family protein [Streptomyces fuscigenes]
MDARRAVHTAVGRALAPLGEAALADLVGSAEPLGSGIGGRSALLRVGGAPVFVKRIPLTATELVPGRLRSTANLFGLPSFCQYNIGGPGFGAWREWAAQAMTTDWVLSGRYEGFPLMYHWRVLPDTAPPLPEELADVDRAVAFWGGGPEVRRRIEELAASPASLVLFLEYLPVTLDAWLTEQARLGDDALGRACTLVERELEAGTAFMNGNGLLHFDAHFGNILTDGRRLHFADYGLALSSGFDLTPAEADFFARHRAYDRAYALSFLVNRLIAALWGHRRDEREALIRECAAGAPLPGGPPEVREFVARHAPLAAVVTEFIGRLERESPKTPYPEAAARRALATRRK